MSLLHRDFTAHQSRKQEISRSAEVIEGQGSTRRVRRALVDGLRVVPVLSAYGAVSLHDVAPGEVDAAVTA